MTYLLVSLLRLQDKDRSADIQAERHCVGELKLQLVVPWAPDRLDLLEAGWKIQGIDRVTDLDRCGLDYLIGVLGRLSGPLDLYESILKITSLTGEAILLLLDGLESLRKLGL